MLNDDLSEDRELWRSRARVLAKVVDSMCCSLEDLEASGAAAPEAARPVRLAGEAALRAVQYDRDGGAA
jgi:hypothetical protein